MRIIGYFKDLFSGKMPFGAKRSSRWYKVRNEHLKEHPYCECCGGKEKIEVHHIKPFHLWPELELQKNNLMTLCERRKCHITFGHLFNYQSFNLSVETDVSEFNKKVRDRP